MTAAPASAGRGHQCKLTWLLLFLSMSRQVTQTCAHLSNNIPAAAHRDHVACPSCCAACRCRHRGRWGSQQETPASWLKPSWIGSIVSMLPHVSVFQPAPRCPALRALPCPAEQPDCMPIGRCSNAWLPGWLATRLPVAVGPSQLLNAPPKCALHCLLQALLQWIYL